MRIGARAIRGGMTKADPMAPDRPVKRSLTINGHRTSVSLETAFWEEFRRLASARGQTLNGLATRIDARRSPPASLASAIRLFVLRELRAEGRAPAEGEPDPGP